LAREIADVGLLSPITVQPASDVKGGLPKKYHYRIVAGHRRFAAISVVNQSLTIPVIVKLGLSETQSLLLNLGENTNRKQLNILQESRALERLRNQGLGQSDIATALKVNRPWVQTRFYVLDFPHDIQEAIGEGILTQSQIHQIHALPEEEWYEAVRHIKDQKIKAGTNRIKVQIPRKAKAEDLQKVEQKNIFQIQAMLEHMMEHGEPCLATRALAWAGGHISTGDLLMDFRRYVEDDLGKIYTIPPNGIDGV
jgi:ParB/RepB/Spo0J family partition protein